MGPVLVLLEDGRPRHSRDDLEPRLAGEFSLTRAERAKKLKNGTPVFRNRIAWALHHFTRARLVERQPKSVYAITQRGREVLAAHPRSIDLKLCMQFDEWHDSKRARARKRAARGTERTAPAEQSGVAQTTKRPGRAKAREEQVIDRDALLEMIFPSGVPPRTSVIRAADVWLDEAERLAREVTQTDRAAHDKHGQ